MAKKSWNDFTKTYPAAPAFSAGVSMSLGSKAPLLDKAGKKLPTPYMLLVEWLKANLAGDWCSMAKSGLVLVKTSDPADAAAITKRFPAVGPAKNTPASKTTTQISYQDTDYAKLATELGYTLK